MRILIFIIFTLVFGVHPGRTQGVIYFNPPTNIVQNGNFESAKNGNGAYGPADWNFTGDGGFVWSPLGGINNSVYVGLADLSQANMYQDLSTISGQTYLLTFYMRGIVGQRTNVAANVFWNSQQVGSFTLSLNFTNWMFESLIIVGGTGSESRLEFSDPNPEFLGLDDVSVVAIPEPSVTALVSFVATVLFIWMYYCRRLTSRRSQPPLALWLQFTSRIGGGSALDR
jgi:hypothetical protein